MSPAQRDAGSTGPTVIVAVAAGLVLLVAAIVIMSPRSVLADGDAKRMVVGHSSFCLEAQPRTPTSPSGIVQTSCSARPAQRFAVTTADTGFVNLTTSADAQCLGFQDDATHRSAVRVEACDGNVDQQYEMLPLGEKRYRFVTRQTGLCLSVNGGAAEDGAALVQNPCTGGGHQEFELQAVSTSLAQDGLWSPVYDVPLIPVAAAVLPDGKLLMWSAFDRYEYTDDYKYGFTETAIFDPATGASTGRTVSNTGHDMFCPGIAYLPDGRILVNGGSSAFDTSIYDPAVDEWVADAAMNIPRGYQGTTLLSDGRALTLGGSFSGGFLGKDAEIWDTENGWQRLPGVTAEPFTGDDQFRDYRGDNHLWLFGWTDGRAFHAGPTSEMHWIDTDGEGTVTDAGLRGDDGFAMNGTAVMFEPGRILTLGGAPNYDYGEATANAHVIDITGDEVTTRVVEPMAHRRGFHNSVVLPNGEVVVTGGVPITGPFEDVDSVLQTEIWSPETETFRVAASHAVARNYHSFSLLLPDGRVIIGGGGLCGACDTNHPDVEIFTPPYLLAADGTPAERPVLVSAPSSVDLGEVFEVDVEGDVASVVLVRLAAATHSVNLDQRRIPLESVTDAGSTMTVTAPDESGVAIPGLYYLFALSSDGVPSEAAIVQVTMETAS